MPVCNKCRHIKSIESFGLRVDGSVKKTCLACESLGKSAKYFTLKASKNPLEHITASVVDYMHANHRGSSWNKERREVYLPTSFMRALSSNDFGQIDETCPRPNIINGNSACVLLIPVDWKPYTSDCIEQIKSGIVSACSYPETKTFLSKNSINAVRLGSSGECSYETASGDWRSAWVEHKTVFRIIVFSDYPEGTFDRIDENEIFIGMKVYCKQFDLNGTVIGMMRNSQTAGDFPSDNNIFNENAIKVNIAFDTVRKDITMVLNADVLYHTVQTLNF